MEPLLVLTHFTLLLMLGILSTILSKWLKMPNIFFLLLVGILIGNLQYEGSAVVDFPEIFIISLGMIALCMVVFDSCVGFRWKDFDTLTMRASKLTGFVLILYLIVLSTVTFFVFRMDNLMFAIIFSGIVSGTSADTVLTYFREKQNRITGLLQVESIINTPLTVLLPFMVLTFMQKMTTGDSMVPEYVVQFLQFLQQFVTGIGAGIVVGILVLKVMRKFYSDTLSPITVITSCILTYILAENLSGNGVLGVTVLGLMYGNDYVKGKEKLTQFSDMFSSGLIILVFILMGLKISIPLNLEFLLWSFVIFIVSVLLRLIAVFVAFPKADYKIREKIFMAINAPKGIAAAIVAFSLLNYKIGNNVVFSSIPDGSLVLNLVLAMVLYSLIFSTIAMRFTKYFIKIEVAK